MTFEEAKAQLEIVRDAMHEEFPDATDRLAQLDSHMATVEMVIQHLYEEKERAANG
jgi:hypothetical protein